MWISRIRVTGGFLKGLDVSFGKGLNVVIGPRGAGKTTILELLRHAVGAEHADQSGSARRDQQVFLEAILGSGEVIVDIEADDGGRHLVVDAKGGGQRLDLSKSVLMLGQNELEGIASDAPSRLNLLDLRTGAAKQVVDRSEIKRLTAEIFSLQADLCERREESNKRERLVADRDLLLSQEAALFGDSKAQLAEQRDSLRLAEEGVIATGQQLKQIQTVRSEIWDLLTVHKRQLEGLKLAAERISSILQESPVNEALGRAVSLTSEAIEALSAGRDGLDEAESGVREQNIGAREATAPLREELEQAEAGLGQVTAQLQNVDTELRALDENDNAMRELATRLSDLIGQRERLLDSAESAEEVMYKERAAVARDTTAHIANNVVVVVEHLANVSEFQSFLQTSLKGSNTRSSVIAAVASNVLPRQLLEMVERRDEKSLDAVTAIGQERALKMIENLNDRHILEGLAEVELADSVDFRLRDGSIDKSVDELSTGQKCAVTLPIVLSERDRTLILDQPEDHLDNAFLVKNIVSGLDMRRIEGAQTIVATHNANIPVLGAADNVIVLSSNGQYGNVEVQERFEYPAIVEKITSLMEGGHDAFARRSAFYSEHGTF